MSNYYEKRKAKVRIAHELMNRGWEVKGYKKDDSDSMTDYYSPANWDGIATKNGYILVVDNSCAAEAQEIKKLNPKGNLSIDDRKKLKMLEDKIGLWATEGEEKNGKELIEKIKSKATGEAQYEVVGYTLAHLGNPKGSIWHIEKDGKIYDKGNSLTKFADVPEDYEYNINKMEYTERYKYFLEWGYVNEEYQQIRKERTLPDETKKVINDFKAFILRLERVINSMNSCGDGTKETENAGIEQQVKAGYEKVKVTETKTLLKMVEVTDRKTIQIGDYLVMDNHYGFWLVTDTGIRTGTWKINGVSTKLEKNTFSYERVGAESRGYKKVKNTTRYYQWEDLLLRDIENGTTKIYELKEVTDTVDVEKWVKIDKTKKASNKTKNVKQKEETKKESVTEQHEQKIKTVLNHEYVITADVDTRDNSPLWVLKIVDKLSKEEYIQVSEKLKTVKGFYSKFKHGFIFKYDPTEILKGNSTITEQPIQNKAEQTAEAIEDYSTDIIIKLGLKPNEYITDQQYKIMLADKIKKCNINITADVINCIEYDDLKEVLKTIVSNAEEQKQQEKYQTEKTVLLEKIEKNITSLQTKIDALSGEYKVNTWKRQQEQASRDNKKESYTINIKMLEYVQTKLLNNEQVTALEKGLIVGAFRTEIHQWYIRKYGRYPREINFPSYDYSLPSDSWWNNEVPKMQNKLYKYNITDSNQLIQAIEEYKTIYNNCCKYESPVTQKIKTLTNQYKMQQKGDIHFTTNKELLNQLIDLADVKETDIVLEPSAGIGCIADEIKKYTNNIDCCEYMTHYSELLKLKGYNVTADDFLTYDKHNHYDKIIANVPFSDEQNHIKHIYKCLKADGRAVIITSNHWTFANDRNSQDFRTWLNNLTYEVYDVPSKSFEFTNVTAKILVIYKDINNLQNAV